MGNWDWLFGGTSNNDTTQDWLKGYNSQNGYRQGNRDLNYDRSNSFYNMLTGGGSMDPSTWLGRASGYGAGMSGALGKANDLAGRSSQDMWNSFSGALPGMMDYAKNASGQAMSLGGQSIQGLADLQAANAGARTSAMLSRTGVGGHSGAAAGAISRAISEPLLNAQSQLGQMQSNAYMSALNPLTQAGYGAELNKVNNFLNLAQGYGQGQAGAMSAANPLLQALSDQSQQQILAPQMQTTQTQGLLPTLLGALLTGGAGSIGGAVGGALINKLLSGGVGKAVENNAGSLFGMIPGFGSENNNPYTSFNMGVSNPYENAFQHNTNQGGLRFNP